MEAEIITIGTELLLGEIVDTNTRTIARSLRDIGLDLYRTTSVGDNIERIAQAVRESTDRAQAIITTGGLGPTVDDPTREAIARAFDVPLEYQPQLWDEIQDKFTQFGSKPADNNKRQAYIPKGAIPISNPVGTAPGFIFETSESTVISLPGVPAELVVLLEDAVVPYLKKRLDLREVIKARIVRTSGVGESWLDNQIDDLERLSNPTVGLAAHPGRVDIRITAKAESEGEVDEMLWQIEATLRQRLGEVIFGIDEDTLEDVVLYAISERGWSLKVFEMNTDGILTNTLKDRNECFTGGECFSGSSSVEEFQSAMQSSLETKDAEVILGMMLEYDEQKTTLRVFLSTPEGKEELVRTYGGPPMDAPLWGLSQALEALRRQLS
ncbi:MAG: CinA family nicotinamide mononucleotide deamidase-related protein [Anaerolineales bacterium]